MVGRKQNITIEKVLRRNTNKETRSMKAGITQLRATDASASMIYRIATTLYRENEKEHKELGLSRPSARVALDYLIAEGCRLGVPMLGNLNKDNNLWLAMTTADQKEA
jgi:hypothetical protein